MSDVELLKVEEATFALGASARDSVIDVRLSGNADTRAIQSLESFVQSVHSEAQRLRPAEVIVDLLKLEFMNSSCFKVFITWLRRLQELGAPERYTIRFRSDASSYWQRRSLHALKSFANEIVVLEEV